MSFYECRMSKFTIKIYDKGKQYNLPNNVLRFEIKVTAMQYLDNEGCKVAVFVRPPQYGLFTNLWEIP